VEPREKKDGWERPIRYTVTDPYPKPQFESGLTLYQKCDVRSAGPNGKFDDDDDISWQGTATP
jgi:hypothetical protein